MNKLTSLSIQNFQSHKNTFLEFHPGVNAIVGESDQGKTAILRAVRWAIKNKPSGDGFRSNWGGNTVVVLQKTNDVEVKRIKGKDDNKYLVNGLELSGFGQSVPNEVETALNIGDINLQAQMDKPFLVSESAGEIARVFNNAIKLDVIDKSFLKISRLKSDAKSKLDAEEKILIRTRNELKEYADLDEIEIKLDYLVQLNNEIAKKTKTESDLNSIFENINHLNMSLVVVKEFLTTEPYLNKLVGMLEEIKIKKDYLCDLEKSQKSIQINKNQLFELTKIIKKSQKKLLFLEQIEKIEIELEKKEELYEKMCFAKKTLEELEKQTGNLKKEKNELQNKLNKILGNLKICPTCLRSF
ncbi:MAG: AAA family ATPase [Candidatus Heimdallarchaeaceae archaeon]